MARIRTARAVILRKHIQSLNAGEQKGTKTAAAALYAIAGAYKDLQDYSHGNTHLTSRPKLPPDTPFVPRYLPEAERIMRSAEFQTHGMSRLNATKFIATFHSARYREPRLAFAQQALDENPNDFHTLHVWTSVRPSGDTFGDSPLKLSGYRRLLEMKPDSARVLAEYALYLPRSETAEKIRVLEKSAQLDPTLDEGATFYWLARAYYDAGELEKAVEALERRLGLGLSRSDYIRALIQSLQRNEGWLASIHFRPLHDR